MQNVQETNLAWALIEAVNPHLSDSERNVVFVVVGAGDTFGAIRRLLNVSVNKQIPLRSDLVSCCSTWLDTYACHEEEQSLRRLIARFLTERMQVSTSMPVKRPPNTPKSVDLLAV